MAYYGNSPVTNRYSSVFANIKVIADSLGRAGLRPTEDIPR